MKLLLCAVGVVALALIRYLIVRADTRRDRKRVQEAWERRDPEYLRAIGVEVK